MWSTVAFVASCRVWSDGTVLLIAHLVQAEVIDWAERSRVDGSVGPTSGSGWTALWWEQSGAPDVTTCPGAYLAVVDADDALTLHVRTADRRVLRRVWPANRGVDPGNAPEEVAAELAGLFSSGEEKAALRALLERELDDPDDLLQALDEILDLPELEEPRPPHTAVAHRGDPALARLAASIAGPAYVSAGRDGWTTLSPAGEEPEAAFVLAAALSGAARRRDAELLVWRNGAACGWQLWARGNPVASSDWNTAWCLVSSDPMGDEAEAVRRLVALATGPVEEGYLRALLRRRRSDGDPLAELADLLGLPGELLDALERPETFRGSAGVALVERVPPHRAVLAQVRGGRDLSDASPARRAAWVVYAYATTVAAALCVGLSALSVAVLATGGAVVDQPGTTGEDWLTLAVSLVGSAVLIPTARWRLRRLKRRRPDEA